MKQPEADPFDLLCHVAFNRPILTRRQRAEYVLKGNKDFFQQFSEVAQEVLHEILDKYTEYGFFELENLNILKIPPISSHGNVIEIAEAFGGINQLKDAIAELQNLVYA
jgi:type I restriction enzyme R subunit